MKDNIKRSILAVLGLLRKVQVLRIVIDTFRSHFPTVWDRTAAWAKSSSSGKPRAATEQAAPRQGKGSIRLQLRGTEIKAEVRELSIPTSKPFSIVVDGGATDVISAALLSTPYELPRHYYMLLDLAPVGGRVLDLGAHIGTFSLFAATHGYDVVAVEASPHNTLLLKQSVRRNGFRNVKVIEAAISDHAGSLEFFESGPSGMVASPRTNGYRLVTVPALTVDSIVEDNDRRPVAVIKMDIEGSEVAAIRGMPGLLSSEQAPSLLFESNGHTLNFFGMTTKDLISALEAFSYRCYHFYGGQLFPIHGEEPQLECVADCLAVKSLPDRFAEKWRIVPPMSLEDQMTLALDQMSSPNRDVRAYIGRTLQDAPRSFFHHQRVIAALDALEHDPQEPVRNSVEWWRATQVADSPGQNSR